MKNLIQNLSWETFSNLAPTEMLAFIVLGGIALALVGGVIVFILSVAYD